VPQSVLRRFDGAWTDHPKSVDPDQDVFRLDVAVHDVFRVQVPERVGHLRNVLLGVSSHTATRKTVSFSLQNNRNPDQRHARTRTTHATTPLLVEPPDFAQLLVQLAAPGKLEDQKDALLVVEIAVQPQDIRVPVAQPAPAPAPARIREI
jgi:hypothetical protein